MDPNHVHYDISSENASVIPTLTPSEIEPLHEHYKDSESEYDTDDTIEDEAYSISDANRTIDYHNSLRYAPQADYYPNVGGRESINSGNFKDNHTGNERNKNPIEQSNDDYGDTYMDTARRPPLDAYSLKYSDNSVQRGDFRLGSLPQDTMLYQSVSTEYNKQAALSGYDNSHTVRLTPQVTRNQPNLYTDTTSHISTSSALMPGLEMNSQTCKYDESDFYDKTEPLTNIKSSVTSNVKDVYEYETDHVRIQHTRRESDMTDRVDVDVLTMPHYTAEQSDVSDGAHSNTTTTVTYGDLTNRTFGTRAAGGGSYCELIQSDETNYDIGKMAIMKDVSYDAFNKPIIVSSDSDDIIGVKSIVGVSEVVHIMETCSEDEVQAVNSSSSIDNDLDASNLDNSIDIDVSVKIDANELDEADLSGLLTEGNGTEFGGELEDIEQENELSELNETELDENIRDVDDENIAVLTEEVLHDSGLLKVEELDQSYEEVGEFLESLPEVDTLQGNESTAIMEESYDSDILNAVNDLAENDENISGIIMESVDEATTDVTNDDVTNDDTTNYKAASHKSGAYSKLSANSAKRARLFDIERRLKKKRKLLKRRSDGTDEPKKKIRKKKSGDRDGSVKGERKKSKKTKTSKKEKTDKEDDDENDSDKKKKTNKERRNIRKIIKEEDLDSETRNAQIEEMERRKRLLEKMKPFPTPLVTCVEPTIVIKQEVIEEPEEKPSQLKSLLEEAEEEAAKLTKEDEDSDDVIMLDSGDDKKVGGKEDEEEKGQDIIELSSDEDDVIMDKEDEDDDVGELEDMNDSGYHVNDLENISDELGRVLVNTKHPSEDPDIFLSPHISRAVKPHQIGGIRFMYDNIVESLSRQKTSNGFGCILAHSMGLGKTIQVIGFTDSYLRCTSAKTVLCIVPINTLQNWMAEFNMWLPAVCIDNIPPRAFRVFLLNDSFRTMAARAQVISEWYKEGGVLLIGYEMYRLVASRKTPLQYGKSKRNVKKSADTEVIDIDEEDKNKVLLEDIHAALINPGPDLVICDEGHRIKNHLAGISKALKNIKTRRRLVLTGYPLQNNLLEYWCMVDFVRPNYLGTKSEFSNMFERPIMNGQCQDSQNKDRRLMRFRAHVLHSLLGGFVQRRSHIVLRNSLPRKQEFVFKIRMSPIQMELYKRFMEIMDELAQCSGAINTLKAFAVCCKIWNHPDIINKVIVRNRAGLLDDDLDLETEASNQSGGTKKKTAKSSNNSAASLVAPLPLTPSSMTPSGGSTPVSLAPVSSIPASSTPASSTPTIFGDGDKSAGIDYEWAQDIMTKYEPGRLENGTKMDLLFELIRESLRVGDKMLVFSQSLFTLNIIEEYLGRCKVPRDDMEENWCRNKSYFRLDGSTQGMERERLINQFNDPQQTKLWLFLLSTRAGSLGINLVGANRVVVMDASWNPCHDCQAICRVFRYGQTRQTYVYRLITDNTLERKIYDRQISKQGMADRVIDELNPQNNFKKSQLDKLLEYKHTDFPEVDFTGVENKIDDEVVVKLLQRKGKWFTSFPFTHESLLIDNKELRLTKQEKRMAKQGYHMEKQYNSFGRPPPFGGQYNAYMSRPYGMPRPPYWSNPNSRPVASVRPIMSNPQLRPNMAGSTGNRMLRPGVTVHPVVTTVDVTLPGKNAEGAPNKIPAGQPVLIIKTPKGIYIRTPEGKIFAVKSKNHESSDAKEGSNELPELFGFAPITKTMVSSSDKSNSSTSLLDSVKQQTAAVTSLLGSANAIGGLGLNKKIGARFPSSSATILHRRADGRFVISGNQSGMRKINPNQIVTINRFQRPGLGARPRGPMTVRIPQSQLAKYPGLLRLPQVKAVVKAASATSTSSGGDAAQDRDENVDESKKDCGEDDVSLSQEEDVSTMNQSTGTSAMSDDDYFKEDGEEDAIAVKGKYKTGRKKCDWMTADDELPDFSDSSENGLSSDEMQQYSAHRSKRFLRCNERLAPDRPEIQPIMVYPKTPIPGIYPKDLRASNLMSHKVDIVTTTTASLHTSQLSPPNVATMPLNIAQPGIANLMKISRKKSYKSHPELTKSESIVAVQTDVQDEEKPEYMNKSSNLIAGTEMSQALDAMPSVKSNVFHTPSFSDMASSFPAVNRQPNISQNAGHGPQYSANVSGEQNKQIHGNYEAHKIDQAFPQDYEQPLCSNFETNASNNYDQKVAAGYKTSLPANYEQASSMKYGHQVTPPYGQQIFDNNDRIVTDPKLPQNYEHNMSANVGGLVSDTFNSSMAGNMKGYPPMGGSSYPNVPIINQQQIGKSTTTETLAQTSMPLSEPKKKTKKSKKKNPVDATMGTNVNLGLDPFSQSDLYGQGVPPQLTPHDDTVERQDTSDFSMGRSYPTQQAGFKLPYSSQDMKTEQPKKPPPRKRDRKAERARRSKNKTAASDPQISQSNPGNTDWVPNPGIPNTTLGSMSNTNGASHIQASGNKPSSFIPPFSSFADRSTWGPQGVTTADASFGHVTSSNLNTTTTTMPGVLKTQPVPDLPSAFNHPASQIGKQSDPSQRSSFTMSDYIPTNYTSSLPSFNSFAATTTSFNLLGPNPLSSSTIASSVAPSNPTLQSVPPSTFSFTPSYNPSNVASYNSSSQFNYNPLSSFSSLLHDSSFSPSSLDNRYLDHFSGQPDYNHATSSPTKSNLDSLRQLSNLPNPPSIAYSSMNDMPLPYHNPYITFPHPNFPSYPYNTPYNSSFPSSSMFSSPYQQQSTFPQSSFYPGNPYSPYPDAGSGFPSSHGNSSGFL